MLGQTLTHDGAIAWLMLSQKGTYGLMSRMGVPSTMSAPPNVMLRPFTSTTSATLRPADAHTLIMQQ